MGFMLFQLPFGIILPMLLIGFMPFQPMPLKLPWFGGKPKPKPPMPFMFIIAGVPAEPSMEPSVGFWLVLVSCTAVVDSVLAPAACNWELPRCCVSSVAGATDC